MSGTEPDGGARVLIVEDEAPLLKALAINLRARGWQVRTAATGTAALEAVAAEVPEVVLLDLGLPDLDGQEVIAGLRGWTRVPIIVLSARHDSAEKVQALDAGADDYVTKPFGMDELLARLRAAARRGASVPAGDAEDADPASGAVVEAGALRIDLARKVVTRDGAPVRLTPTEWHLLEVLVRHRGRLVDQVTLLQEVWGPQYRTETNYLRVYAAQLRRKLEAEPSAPVHLITVPGVGYRFEV
ncbi:MAG: response regulator transcription factor [Kineosporiaceae bacterium]